MIDRISALLILRYMPKYRRRPEHLFLAIGDPTRLAVVARLCRGPASVTELAEPFAMALPSFLQHLRLLENAEWIHTEKKGRVRVCTMNPAALQDAAGWLDRQRNLWERRLDQMDDYLLKLKKEKGDRT